MCYLENVVFDIADLNVFLWVSIWARGCQQRLESTKHMYIYLF